MSRRLGLRLVPTRMADDVAEELTDGDAEQVPDEDLCDEPVAPAVKSSSAVIPAAMTLGGPRGPRGQPPALGVLPAATPSR